MSYTPKTRLEKILCGVEIAARNGLEKAVKAAMERIESALELPTVTTTDNGKVLKVVAGKWQKAADSGDTLPTVSAADNGFVLGVVGGEWAKDSPFLAVTGTIGQNESEKATITLNKTAAELYAAIGAGKSVLVTYSTGENASTAMGCFCSGAKSTSGETVTYGFYMTDFAGTQYAVSSLAGTDAVVLTAA